MQNDTIAAIATPIGTGGISIIKISGSGAMAAVATLFRPRNTRRSLAQLNSQTMLFGHIYESQGGAVVDEVLVTVLRGPHSFTGEDVVEINCHGGRQVAYTILDLILDRSVRLAEPGEFTRRAFMNGRIDLTQVEATIDLIQARTRRAAQLGSRMLKNGLGTKIKALLSLVEDLIIRIEAAIEFSEEADLDLSPHEVIEELRRNVWPTVNQLIEGYRQGALVRHGLRVVLAGKPNVGKSSLMNKLLREDRVIVTDVPGTTRDTIEEGVEIDGIPILISDTAGLRDSSDPIEQIGQEKTQQAIEKADLILFMIDGSKPIDDADRDIAERFDGYSYIVLRNKIDLVSDSKTLALLDSAPAEGYLDISALNGDGLETLKSKIISVAGVDPRIEDDACLPNRRQKDVLIKLLSVLDNAFEHGQAIEALAIDLRDCERLLHQIIGIDVEQDVLDGIFQRFCIGK